MENNKIKVSVIIPVYNAQKYLQECLDSIIYQTLKDIEIICVEDGSKDNSLDILKRYADKDDRITILQQENQGPGVARKNGLAIAKGEYLSFLDADDFFDLKLLEKSYNKAISTDADVTICKTNSFNDQTKQFSLYVSGAKNGIREENLPDNDVFSCDDMADNIFNTFGHEMWNKLFKTSFIKSNNIGFPSMFCGEDKFFTCLSLACAEKITVLDEVLVYYRVGINSISTKLDKIPLDLLYADVELMFNLKKRNVYDKLDKSIVKSVLSSALYNLNAQKTYNGYKTVYEHLVSEFEKYFNVLKYVKYFDTLKIGTDEKHYLNIYFENYKLIQKNSVDEYLKLQQKYFIDLDDNSLKISVIIPVYNVDKYLRDCLDSVINQTLTDIEIICVNDGSTDTSGDILREYAQKDSRIIILNQVNQGQTYARNKGLEIAKGKYIYFLDSDDMIVKYAFQNMYEQMFLNDLDILYFDANLIYESNELEEKFSTTKKYYKSRKLSTDIMSGAKMLVTMQQKKCFNVQPCLYLTKAKFLKESKFKFKEGMYREDNLFTFQTMLTANRVKHLQENLYIYRIRGNSTMTVNVTYAHFHGYFTCYIEMLEFINKYEYTDDVEEAIVSVLYGVHYCTIRDYKKLSQEDLEKINSFSKLENYYFYNFFVPKLETKNNSKDDGELTEKLNWNRNELRKSQKTINKYIGQIDYYKNKYEETRGLMNKYKGQVRYHKNEKESLKNSLSFRIGRIITWLPRKLQ